MGSEITGTAIDRSGSRQIARSGISFADGAAMTTKGWILVGALLLLGATAQASTEKPIKILRAYGPGGPHHAIEECADLFRERHGVQVLVTKVLPHDLERRLREDGDIYFGGAEYMLEEFVQGNPDILDVTSVQRLSPRRIGIIVRKGNPCNIQNVSDLQNVCVDILDVKLENMRLFQGAPSCCSSHIERSVYTGQQGVSTWQDSPEIDAWVTYKSWHALLKKETEFIEIPGDYALRFTPMALTKHTPNRQEAEQFLLFLKSEEARRIFQNHGWD